MTHQQTMTAAQAAQQRNRDASGQYKTRTHAEPGQVAMVSADLDSDLADASNGWGPYGRAAASVIHRARRLTGDEARRLTAARKAVDNDEYFYAFQTTERTAYGSDRGDLWEPVGGNALYSATDAIRTASVRAGRCVMEDLDVWTAADSARGAAVAIAYRDLIPDDDYDSLTRPWRNAIGDL